MADKPRKRKPLFSNVYNLTIVIKLLKKYTDIDRER